ncbi:unnamed protein product [Linum trigynum]|uniref:Uncharacterized protein n=1 Tax=Linum trigynum TaxID=586398 RepID=A0AAV2GQW5_9ROSI
MEETRCCNPLFRGTQSTKRCSLSSSPARRLQCRRRNSARRSQRDDAINEILLLVVTLCSPSSLSSSESGSPQSNRER